MKRKVKFSIQNALGPEYAALLNDVKRRIKESQYKALRAVNQELIGLYWDIGGLIHARRKSDAWGKATVLRLAHDLQTEFPGMGGFSPSNLWRMKAFYEVYSRQPKLAPMVREIGWSHNLMILEKCGDPLEREFYIRMTRQYGWSKNVLALKIDAQTFKSALTSQTNFSKTLPAKIRNQAKLAVKDEYTFDFLELGEEHAERELELAILSKVERFLREMGGRFSFVGSQYRLEIKGREYFIDLLL